MTETTGSFFMIGSRSNKQTGVIERQPRKQPLKRHFADRIQSEVVWLSVWGETSLSGSFSFFIITIQLLPHLHQQQQPSSISFIP